MEEELNDESDAFPLDVDLKSHEVGNSNEDFDQVSLLVDFPST